MENSEWNCAFSDTVVISENSRKCQASATGSSGTEETSPDLLRNTPSNIRRLEDAIEQCEGRQKYLAQTRSPSDGGDVRWYYCKVPLAENGVFLVNIENSMIDLIILFCSICSIDISE